MQLLEKTFVHANYSLLTCHFKLVYCKFINICCFRDFSVKRQIHQFKKVRYWIMSEITCMQHSVKAKQNTYIFLVVVKQQFLWKSWGVCNMVNRNTQTQATLSFQTETKIWAFKVRISFPYICLISMLWFFGERRSCCDTKQLSDLVVEASMTAELHISDYYRKSNEVFCRVISKRRWLINEFYKLEKHFHKVMLWYCFLLLQWI